MIQTTGFKLTFFFKGTRLPHIVAFPRRKTGRRAQWRQRPGIFAQFRSAPGEGRTIDAQVAAWAGMEGPSRRTLELQVVVIQEAGRPELVVSSLCVFLSQHTLQILH